MSDFLRPPTPGTDVVLVDADESWPGQYTRQESRIRTALGTAALEIHHAGSTAVPGLAAKPVLDVVLVVADPADEAAYVPVLEAASFLLHLRERNWHRHRLLRGQEPRVNLHVFGPGCEEVFRMLSFRDHLRHDEADRALYERTKRELAARRWARVQDYADAKSEVVTDILGRALR